jgi:MoxR-like ATPase
MITATATPKIGKNSLRSSFSRAIAGVNTVVVDREIEILLIYSGIVAGANVLLGGTPGEGKSRMVNQILKTFDVPKFDITLFQSMDSDEVIGGQRLDAMAEGRTVRNVDGFLPTATLAFLDEIGKCPDTLRTALMSLLNERTYVNDGVRLQSPLTSVIAATNEYNCDVEGFASRFAVKINVGAASFDTWMKLANQKLDEHSTNTRLQLDPSIAISPEKIMAANYASKTVTIPRAVLTTYFAFASAIRDDHPIDTRLVMNGLDVLKAYTWLLEGYDAEMQQSHLNIIPHLLSAEPNRIGTISKLYEQFSA